MQHDFIRPLGGIARVPLTPIVTDGVGKYVPGAIESCGRDGASHFRVALEAVLRVLVPEVEGAVAACGAKSAVYGMEGDGVDGEDVGSISLIGRCLTVAFE